MACDPKHAPAALHHPLGPFDVFVSGVLVPVVALDEAWRKEDVDNEHYDVLEGAAAGVDEPLLFFVGKAGAEVVESPQPASVVVLPHTSTEKAGEAQICFDAEPVQYEKCDPQRNVSQPIEQGIGVFLLSSFFGHLRHSETFDILYLLLLLSIIRRFCQAFGPLYHNQLRGIPFACKCLFFQ